MQLLPRPPKGVSLTNVLDWLVVLPALLVPVFFLPLTPDSMAFNKLLLLLLFVLVAGVVWFARLVRTRTLDWVSTPFARLLGLFLLVATVAWLFSPYRYTSFVGIAGFFNHPLALLLLLGGYALLVSQLSSRAELHRLLRLLALGGGVVFVYNAAKLFGLELLPFADTSVASFMLATNSSGVLGLLAAVALVLSLGLFAREPRPWRVALAAVAVLAFLLLVLLDHRLGWVGAIVGLGLLLLTRLLRPDAAAARATVGLSLLIALSSVLFLIPTGRFTTVSPPADVVLDGRTSRAITASVLRSDPMFGRGPESFPYAFVSDRPQEYNDTAFWNIRFLKGSNEFHQLLVSVGIAGTLSFFALVLLLAGYAVHRVLRERDDGERTWAATVTASWLTLVVSMFFFPWSLLTTFLFFALTGVLLGQIRLAHRRRPVRLDGGRYSLALVGFALFIVLAVTGLFLGGRFWVAEATYARALDGIARTEDILTVRGRLVAAIGLHPWEAKYYFTLAQTELVRSQLELQKAEPDEAELRSQFATALDAVQRAVRVEPLYPDTYEQLADFYLLAQRITGGDFYDAAIGAYGLAAGVEPQNPFHYLTAGQLELARADAIAARAAEAEGEEARAAVDEQRAQALERASGFFDESLQRKQGFPAALLGNALVLERQGDPDGAVAAIQAILAATPTDEQSWLELGRILEGQGRETEAINAFTQATNLNPVSSTAFFSLAQLLEAQGDRAAARAAYERVNELVPGNPTVTAKIEELGE